MSKELVIGSNRHETKVAVLEDDQLVEVFFQRANEYSLAGSIHKGRVTRVLPGMQSAFVDLGLERDTFLYVSDFFEEHPDIDTLSDEKAPRPARSEQRRERSQDREAQREVSRTATAEEPEQISAESVQSAAAGAPEPATGEGGDSSRERRGRRSRRRRSRGRGFPESKYAQPPAAGETPEPIDEPEQAEEGPAADVVVLPGESLAKYRGVQGAGELETADDQDLAESDAGEQAESDSGPDEVNQAQEKAAQHARDLRYDDFAIHVVSELDDEAMDAAEARAEEIAEIVEAQHAALDNGELPDHEIEVEFVSEQPEDETAVLVLETEIETEPESLEQQATEQAAESDDADVSDEETQHESEGDNAGAVDEMNAEAGSEPAAPGENPEGQSAAVREQGGRYLQHRMSRRMRRRRGKFGQQNSGSGETTAQSQAAAPAEAATASAAETRREESKPDREDREAKGDRALPSITDLLKPGQEIIVQIAKEPLGQKGARITSHVALPGRFVVYMPSVEHMGVSRKIASDEERYRLKKILQAHRVGTTGGFIIRTAGEGRTEDEIAADMNFLYNLWLDIRQKAEKKPAPALLHHDLDLVQRLLRDQLTDDFKAIWVDQEEMYENVLRFIQRFQPALVSRVKMYTRKAPVFDAFNITQELEKALRPKVWLKSGGYIVINQTEALVAIDVNTGKFVGKSNRLEDTIVKTNTEAVKEIVRQIRLRDLGGIIVVDFIDMDERKNRQKVMQALEEAMRADKAPYKILQFNDFGLVAITRKRVKQSLERTLCAPCPYCEGAGYVKSVQTVISEILIEAQKIAAAIEGKDVVLRCNPEVAKTLKSKDNQYLEELEEVLGRPVLVRSDVQLHLEKFDLA